MQGDNLHEMSKHVFLEKKKETYHQFVGFKRVVMVHTMCVAIFIFLLCTEQNLEIRLFVLSRIPFLKIVNYLHVPGSRFITLQQLRVDVTATLVTSKEHWVLIGIITGVISMLIQRFVPTR